MKPTCWASGRRVAPTSPSCTVAGAAGALPGRTTTRRSLLAAYPYKGRGTQGVRVQRFTRGEDRLILRGLGITRGSPADGTPVEPDERRDASGTLIT